MLSLHCTLYMCTCACSYGGRQLKFGGNLIIHSYSSEFPSHWPGRTSPRRLTSTGFSMSQIHRGIPTSTRSPKRSSTTIFPGSSGASGSSSRWSTPYWPRLNWGRTYNRSKVNTRLPPPKLRPFLLREWRVWPPTARVGEVVAVARHQIRRKRAKVCCLYYMCIIIVHEQFTIIIII